MPAIDPTTLGEATERAMQRLEMRIMRDIVRRIRENGFSTASADWQISRLQQLGHAEEQVQEWVQDALGASDEEIEEIFSDEVYRSYVGNEPAYRHTGKQQTPYAENYPLQQTVQAMREQTSGTMKNITRSMGFVEVIPGTRRTRTVSLTDFYRQTLDDAIYDIQSGAFDYTSVLQRAVTTMTRSGIRQIDYASGSASRIDVAARRAVMTGFRQVQGKISEQTAAELGTDTFEVSYHGGARPSHAEWQGGVYTKQELTDICGLGDVTGLCGANCYHTYWPFIPGVDKPVYSADELERMRAQEEQTRTYQGREYTPYEATQAQRDLERRMRKDEEDLYLLREGGADEETLALKEAHLNGLRQTYSSFSDRMELPKHWERARAMDPDDGIRRRAVLERARIIKTESDLKTVSTSSIISMSSDTEIAEFFDSEYGIEVGGFSGKAILSVQSPLAGYDDMLREFPELQSRIRGIHYAPRLSANGDIDLSTGLSRVGKSGLSDYGTGVHEAAHMLDHIRSSELGCDYAAKIVEQARKNLGLRKNEKKYIKQVYQMVGLVGAEEVYQDPKELFAFGIETAKSGISNPLAMEIYRLAKGG